jgi:lipoprotein NlpD
MKFLKQSSRTFKVVASGVLVAAGLVGCASKSSAPVVHRTSGTETSEAKREFYTVGRGDTLTSIGQRFGVAVKDLQDWNNLGNTPVLQAGQVLRLTAPARPVVATAPAPMPAPASETAQTAPIRPPVAVAAPVEAPRPALKTGPKGLKRPYSDEAYAQMARGADASRPEIVPTVATPKPAETAPAPAVTASETKTDSAGLAWSWPVAGRVMQVFDGTRSRGITLSGDPGKPVLAAAKGKVIFAKEFADYGRLVIVSHGPDLVSVYAQNNAISVKDGQTVERGQKIAEQGPRVQFEIRRAAKAVDPVQYLPQR